MWTGTTGRSVLQRNAYLHSIPSENCISFPSCLCKTYAQRDPKGHLLEHKYVLVLWPPMSTHVARQVSSVAQFPLSLHGMTASFHLGG